MSNQIQLKVEEISKLQPLQIAEYSPVEQKVYNYVQRHLGAPRLEYRYMKRKNSTLTRFFKRILHYSNVLLYRYSVVSSTWPLTVYLLILQAALTATYYQER